MSLRHHRFLDRVAWAVQNRDKARALGRARAYVLRERTIEKTIAKWRAAVESPRGENSHDVGDQEGGERRQP